MQSPMQQLSSRSHVVVSATPLPERPRQPNNIVLASPRRRGRRQGHTTKILGALICCVAIGCFLASLALQSQSSGSGNVSSRAYNAHAINTSRRIEVDIHELIAQPVSLDSVVEFLMRLAEKRPAELWNVFGMDGDSYGEDPFSLSMLETGQCPWTASSSKTVDWLPLRPLNSAQLSAAFQSNMKSSSSKVVLWYEHISKAGGTTFCGLANSNMPRLSVPRYHCMPRKGELLDGRVGSWPNDEFVEFINDKSFSIVANEWDPFDVEKLKLSGRDLFGSSNKNNLVSPNLLFVTTLRDPADRLLSSYTFFSNFSEEQQSDAKNFGVWLKKNLGRVRNFKAGGRSAFRSNIARNNYMVWRFSGGGIPHYSDYDDSASFSTQSKIFPSSVTDTSVWKKPFEIAIRALSNHDLVIPMDVLTQESGKQSLHQLLGWEQYSATGRGIVGEKESGHVVTHGKVRNSNAREYLLARKAGDEFRALWERNWLDYILFYWARAVFFARLNCKNVVQE